MRKFIDIIKTKAFLCLLAIGVIIAHPWLFNMEYPNGSILVGHVYYHWLLPFGIGLFPVWLFVFAPLRDVYHRLALAICAMIAGLLWFYVMAISLAMLFGRFGALGLLIYGEEGCPLIIRLGYPLALISTWPATPFLFAAMLRVFGCRPGFAKPLMGAFLFMLPLAVFMILLLWLDSAIHPWINALSAFTVISLVVGLGIPAIKTNAEKDTRTGESL